ncbi:hypothetical protein WIW50_10180 [Flavobacteriaceae bacterium 3-367]
MEKASLLRKALRANGFFSLGSALVAIVLGNSLRAVNEMVNGQPVAFAVQLVVFGSIVLYAAYRKKIPKILVWVIIVLDFLYVLMGFVHLGMQNELSLIGIALIVLTNLAVLIFATLQTLGIRRYMKTQKSSTLMDKT